MLFGRQMNRSARVLGGCLGHLSVGALLSGMLGGLLVVGVFAIVNWWVPSTKVVTVEEIRPGLVTSNSGRTGVLPARQIYRQDSAGVVFISAVGVNSPQSASEYFKGEGGQQTTATGSGFEVDDEGTILADWHVVDGATKTIIGVEHGRTVEARIISKDPSHDVAVLRISTAGLTLHPLLLDDSGSVSVGDPVLAIGNPFWTRAHPNDRRNLRPGAQDPSPQWSYDRQRASD
jgi:S1-C subfamily serine protease